MLDKERTSVLMIDSERTWRGGEGQLLLLLKGLTEEDFDVTLAAAEDAAISLRARAIGVRCLPLRISGGVDLAAAWKLSGIVSDGQFDIVHTHSSHAHSVAFLAAGVAKVRWGGRRRPYLVVSRRVDFPVGGNGFSALKYRHGGDVYLAISKGVRDVLIESGIEGDRIELVRSGIDLAKFTDIEDSEYLREEFRLPAGAPVVGNIAALAPHKSQEDFVRAAGKIAESVPDARFLIVGEGEKRQNLESVINSLGLRERVILTGFRRDVLELLSLFDCFVISSYLEGLCTSIMDAQALGVPVVATRTGGIPDLVSDGETGLLVEPRCPDKLAGAILRMLSESELREKCVEQAKQKSASYDYRVMVRGTINAYRRLLD